MARVAETSSIERLSKIKDSFSVKSL